MDLFSKLMISEGQVSTRQATLTLLLRQGEASASKLAGVMGISVQAMRRHLRSLERAGLVEPSVSKKKTGRPSNIWHLTTQGQNSFTSVNGSETFVLDLLASLSEHLSEKDIEQVWNTQVMQKARIYQEILGDLPLNQRLEKLVELRNKEGFLVELMKSEDGLSWFLNALHCSIQNIAEQYPMVCDYELILMRTIFHDCHIQRVHWRLDSGHSCGFEVTPIAIIA